MEVRIETIAIMQPYFLPYAGYFRLFAGADRFVVYDCVQFTRRGWVHRNRLPDANGALQWLTLPLAPAPIDVRIDALQFAPDASERFTTTLRRFPLLDGLDADMAALLRDVAGSPVDYLERLLAAVCERLGVACRMSRSSALALPSHLKGTARLIAICRTLGARRYLNAPGGRDLYDADDFAREGIELVFLPPWDGDMASVLHPLAAGRAADVGAQVRAPSALKGAAE